MKIFEVHLLDGSIKIVFGKNRRTLWKKYNNVKKIYLIEVTR